MIRSSDLSKYGNCGLYKWIHQLSLLRRPLRHSVEVSLSTLHFSSFAILLCFFLNSSYVFCLPDLLVWSWLVYIEAFLGMDCMIYVICPFIHRVTNLYWSADIMRYASSGCYVVHWYLVDSYLCIYDMMDLMFACSASLEEALWFYSL